MILWKRLIYLSPFSAYLVHFSQLLPDLSLGNRGPVRVEHVHHHLAPLQQAVGHVLPRADGNRALGLKI